MPGSKSMDTQQIDPYYSPLPQADIDMLAGLVRRTGFAPVLKTLADILIQSPQSNAAAQPTLSFSLGAAMAAAERVDSECPPAG